MGIVPPHRARVDTKLIRPERLAQLVLIRDQLFKIVIVIITIISF